ncbi:fibronectin type III domain-containing protein [Eubacteriales bacterium OttesenSCG-928-K08]|nr:fibronectin type III domain-containing protein [Eubacteriales bacterium OttesenSCG-928-K08]
MKARKIFSLVVVLAIMVSVLCPMATMAAPPDVSARSAYDLVVGETYAELFGYVNANKGIEIEVQGFEYKKASSGSWKECEPYKPKDPDDREIKYTLRGLEPGTTYDYRAFAVNVNGEISHSASVRFTTKSVSDNITVSSFKNHTITEGDILRIASGKVTSESSNLTIVTVNVYSASTGDIEATDKYRFKNV